MDERDLKIISSIAELGTGNTDKISEATGIPQSTVHYRMKRLREEGVFTDDIFTINIKEMNINITVITEVYANFKQNFQDIVGHQLAEIEGVNQVYFIMGETDFITIAHLHNHDQIERLVNDYERIEEINRTNSKYVVSTYRNSHNPVKDYDIETLLDLSAQSSIPPNR